jgi:hypothetical protein
LIGVGNAYVGNALVALQVNNGIEKRDEDYFFFSLPKILRKATSLVISTNCMVVIFEAKLQKKCLI